MKEPKALNVENNANTIAHANSAKTAATIAYALYAAALLLGVTSIVAVIYNYLKHGDVASTIAESHFRWQMRTFWFSLLWAIIGVITWFAFVGYIILLANLVWYIYRVIRGWVALSNNKPMYA